MDKYDFKLNGGLLKQEELITSIIEGRMVPRDLSEFEEAEKATEDMFVYVDNNGSPEKMSMTDIKSGSILIVEEEPADALNGQIIFKEIR